MILFIYVINYIKNHKENLTFLFIPIDLKSLIKFNVINFKKYFINFYQYMFCRLMI